MIDVYTFKILNFINSLNWATYDEICNYINRECAFENDNFIESKLKYVLNHSCNFEIIDNDAYHNRTYKIAPNHQKPSEYSYFKYSLNAKGKEEYQEYYNYYVLPKNNFILSIQSMNLAKQSLDESRKANDYAKQSLSESKTANDYADKSLKTSKQSNLLAIIGIILSIIALIVSLYSCHKM